MKKKKNISNNKKKGVTKLHWKVLAVPDCADN